MQHWYRLFTVIIFLTLLLSILDSKVETYQFNKGVAISNYLFHYHNYEISPDEAKYFDITATQWDVSIQDLDVFGTFGDK